MECQTERTVTRQALVQLKSGLGIGHSGTSYYGVPGTKMSCKLDFPFDHRLGNSYDRD